MLQGFYTIASGMYTQQHKLNVIGNNIVNANKSGFRAQRVVAKPFEDAVTTRIEYLKNRRIGPTDWAVIVDDVSTLETSGNLKNTERSMDVAINGGGYYKVEGNRNDIYYLTRNGGFDVDNDGYLVIPELGYVLTEENERIEVGDTNFIIGYDGEVISSTGESLGYLGAFLPEDMAALEQFDNGVFGVPRNTEVPLNNVEFMQNYLELSNIDMNVEYTMMMEAQSAFRACSTALQIYDKINQLSSQQIASI